MYLQSAPGLAMEHPTPCCGKKLPPPNSGQRKFLGTKRPKPREPFSLYARRVKKNSGMLSDGVSARTNITTKPASALSASAGRRSVFCMWWALYRQFLGGDILKLDESCILLAGTSTRR